MEVVVFDHADFHVDVRTADVAGAADQPDDLALFHVLAFLGDDRFHVGVERPDRLAAIARVMADDHNVAVGHVQTEAARFGNLISFARENDRARGGGMDRFPDRVRHVDAVMDAPLVGGAVGAKGIVEEALAVGAGVHGAFEPVMIVDVQAERGFFGRWLEVETFFAGDIRTGRAGIGGGAGLGRKSGDGGGNGRGGEGRALNLVWGRE